MPWSVAVTEGYHLRSAHPGMDLCLRVSPYFIPGELIKKAVLTNEGATTGEVKLGPLVRHWSIRRERCSEGFWWTRNVLRQSGQR